MGNCIIPRRGFPIWEERIPAGALYWEGNECTELTGGWDVSQCSYTEALQKVREQLESRADSFYGALTTYWSIKYRGTENKIDFTGYNKIKCQFSYTTATRTYAQLYVMDTKDANYLNYTPLAIATTSTSTTDGILEVNVASIPNGYVFVCIQDDSASGGSGANVTFTKIWLE